MAGGLGASLHVSTWCSYPHVMIMCRKVACNHTTILHYIHEWNKRVHVLWHEWFVQVHAIPLICLQTHVDMWGGGNRCIGKCKCEKLNLPRVCPPLDHRIRSLGHVQILCFLVPLLCNLVSQLPQHECTWQIGAYGGCMRHLNVDIHYEVWKVSRRVPTKILYSHWQPIVWQLCWPTMELPTTFQM